MFGRSNLRIDESFRGVYESSCTFSSIFMGASCDHFEIYLVALAENFVPQIPRIESVDRMNGMQVSLTLWDAVACSFKKEFRSRLAIVSSSKE